jgi:predicted anti-sigma-YlaC factor YlaD
MILSCEVVKDLLPLYYDKVCSKESCSLIEEHLAQCPQCVNELQKLKMDLEKPSVPEGEVKAMKRISTEWKKDKKVSFTRGSMFVSALAAIICFISYHIIGAKVLPDGTLVEPFALIPIGYLFVLVFIISLICSLLFSRKQK